MRTIDLTRALHRQADEAIATAPAFEIGALAQRRARARRRLAVGGAVVATLATATVVAMLSGAPTRDGGQPGPAGRPSGSPSVSASPSPSATASPSATPSSGSGWQAVDCSAPDLGGCDIPMTLTYRGRTWTQLGGSVGSQPVHWRNGVNREIGMSVVPVGARQLVLVGATGAGPGSTLSVSVNWATSEPLDAGALTPVLLDITPDSQHVTVREDGTAPQDEVLQIATYQPAH